MRMLQMYHSAELQHSHSILKDNLKSKSKSSNTENENPEFIFESIKKNFSKDKKRDGSSIDLLREQMSEFEIKSILDKVNTKDISKEFKRPTKKFTNLLMQRNILKTIFLKNIEIGLKIMIVLLMK